jgi:hypothetical protein
MLAIMTQHLSQDFKYQKEKITNPYSSPPVPLATFGANKLFDGGGEGYPCLSFVG